MEPTTIEAVVQALVGLATLVLTSIIAPLLLKQFKVADAKLDASSREAIYPALINAIAYATGALSQDEQAKLAASAKLKAGVVDSAADYIERNLGGTLKTLGVTDSGLRDLLAARLQQAINAVHPPAPTV